MITIIVIIGIACFVLGALFGFFLSSALSLAKQADIDFDIELGDRFGR